MIFFSLILQEKGIQTTHNNCEVVRSCNVVILACKPYHVTSVSAEIKSEVTKDKIVISVIAGITIPALESVSIIGNFIQDLYTPWGKILQSI